jgi:hypothetical protein
MRNLSVLTAAVLGGLLCLGALGLGMQLSGAALHMKSLERTVEVKGLAEREVAADVAIWPIQFTEVGNDLTTLVEAVEHKTAIIRNFLQQNGFTADEITTAPPAIVDKQALNYGSNQMEKYRYTTNVVITLYSGKVEQVRETMRKTIALGKQGIAIGGQQYGEQASFTFSGLNQIKPAMVEEATRNAREVAVQFARDSDSKLGKIKMARQGQFSISDRDSNTPHIKKVRVVSTVEYYLSD